MGHFYSYAAYWQVTIKNSWGFTSFYWPLIFTSTVAGFIDVDDQTCGWSWSILVTTHGTPRKILDFSGVKSSIYLRCGKRLRHNSPINYCSKFLQVSTWTWQFTHLVTFTQIIIKFITLSCWFTQHFPIFRVHDTVDGRNLASVDRWLTSHYS